VLNSLKGLWVTFRTTLRRPITAQYPNEHMPVQDRYMGFPALTWDSGVGEPYCVACMVCIRECPTQCMSATMMDNPNHAKGVSSRRKMVESFEINFTRCIICGICVDVCNFDAIEMSHEHELSSYTRNQRRTPLPLLLEMGRRYQTETNWQPPSKRISGRTPVQVANSTPSDNPQVSDGSVSSGGEEAEVAP